MQPHQFARQHSTGIKFLLPHGDSAERIPAASLPTHPLYSGLSVRCETCEGKHPASQMHPVETGLQCHTCHAPTTRQLVGQVAGTENDFEFYPTTAGMIAAMLKHAHRICEDTYTTIESVLDIGAGSGKVLLALRDDEKLHVSSLYAIEKSFPLLQNLPPDVLIIGTEFREQSLLSKPADLTFCNPPYSAFEEWTVKIVKESTSPLIYLIIPQRWKDSHAIKTSLEHSGKVSQVLESFDFENAEDRAARAKVDLLCITDKGESPRSRRHSRHDSEKEMHSAFRRQFDEQFSDFIAAFEATADNNKQGSSTHAQRSRFDSIVPGENYPAALVAMYQADLALIQRNYAAASLLDPDLLREFDIYPAKVCACLHHRLSGLRSLYWHQLFDQLAAINTRLTSASRARLLGKLHKHVHVDFTVSNIEAVVLWVIKNTNQNLDAQLVETYEQMVEKCNVRAYKSNARTFEHSGWRYNAASDKWSHYALDYRIVCQHIGGISSSSWRGTNGLSESAHTFIEDLRTVAANLGYGRTGTAPTSWSAGETEHFYCMDPVTKQRTTLFTVRAFGNGNLHLKLNQKFILALNVEHGRLKGWINTPAEAAEEMRDPAAAAHFKTNLALPAGTNPFLLAA